MSKKTWVSIIFLLVSIVYLVRGINLTNFVRSLKHFPALSIAFLIAGTMVSYIIMAIRWSVLSRETRFRGALESSILSIGINNIVPARIGDISRIVYLRKVYGVPLFKLIPVSILERVLDLAGLLLIGAVFAFSYDQVKPVIVTLAVIFIVLIIVICIFMRRPARLLKFLKRLKFRKYPILTKGTRLAIRSAIALLRISGRQFWVSFGITLMLWFFYVLILYGFARFSDITAIQITYFQAILIFIVVGLGVSLPSTPGSLGLYEAAFVLSMGWFGIAKEMALPFALVYHIVQILLSLVLTFAILNIKNIKSIKSINRS